MKINLWRKARRALSAVLAGLMLAGSFAPATTTQVYADQIVRNGLTTDDAGVWAYFVNGVVDTAFTGLVQNEAGWWYVENGYLDWGHTGLVANDAGLWYVEEGGINFNFTDLYCAPDGWYYVMDGRVPTEYTGLVRNSEGLWYVENGMINWNYTGLVSSAEGWYYVLNGRVTEEYTGLVANDAGKWYIAAGILDWSHTALVSDIEGWYYVMDGRVTEEYTGLVSNDEGMWYIDGGKLDWSHCGLVSSVNGWFYVQDGRVPEEYVGLVANDAGTWFVQNGTISFNYQGLVSSDTGWWYVNKSQVDKTYTGLATNEAGTWYVQEGYLDFNFSGDVTIDGVTYPVSGGQVPVKEDDKEEEKPAVTTTKTVKDGAGRSYELGFDADGNMITQTIYDTNGKLLNENTVTYYESQYAISLSDDDKTTVAHWTVFYNATGTVTRTNAYNNTKNTVYYAEITSVDADGNVTCSFGSLEPQKQVTHLYKDSGALNYYYVNDYGANGLREKYTYYYADGTVRYYTLYVDYDAAGNVLKAERYIADGTLDYYYIYEDYDANGNAAKVTYYNADGSLDYSYLYSYHTNGEMKREEYRDADGILQWYYVYDSNGLILESGDYYYDDKNELAEFYKSVYENGTPVKDYYYDGSMNLLEYTDYEYDSNGEVLLKSYTYDAVGALQSYSVYAYHSNGKRKTITHYNSSDLMTSLTEYDENGNSTQRTTYSYRSGKLYTYTVTKYNDDQNVVSQVTYNAEDNSVSNYTYYEYDSNGVRRKITRGYGDGRIDYVREYYANGKTSKYVYYYYDYKDNSLKYYEVQSWDERGNTISIIRYDANDAVMQRREYVYEGGVHTATITYNADGKATGKSVFEYHANGETKKVAHYVGADLSVLESIEEYDENGNEILYLGYDENGTVVGKTVYEYHDNGELKKETSYVGEGATILVYLCEYNEDGNEVLEIYYNEDGTIDSKQESEYYANGNCKKEVTYTETGKISSLYEYDEEGNRTYYVFYSYDYETDEVINWQERKYENGNVISEIWYDGNNKMTSKELYKYYSNGELKQQEEYNAADKLTQITYYNEAGKSISGESWIYDYSTGELRERRVYTYDAGTWNETSRKHYNAEGVLTYHSETTYHNEDGDEKTYKYYYITKGEYTGAYLQEYDLEGNMIKQIRYHADGTVNYYDTYEYYEDGSRKITNYNANDVIQTEEVRSAYGDRISSKDYYHMEEDGQDGYWYTEYDEFGQCVYEEVYTKWEDGYVNHYKEWFKDGNLVKQVRLDAEGRITQEAEYDGDYTKPLYQKEYYYSDMYGYDGYFLQVYDENYNLLYKESYMEYEYGISHSRTEYEDSEKVKEIQYDSQGRPEIESGYRPGSYYVSYNKSYYYSDMYGYDGYFITRYNEDQERAETEEYRKSENEFFHEVCLYEYGVTIVKTIRYDEEGNVINK